nr:MAG TPA: HELIX POMATIA AGGLUTININ, SNAIL, HELIX POMATIA [Caudoviricetes sp.]
MSETILTNAIIPKSNNLLSYALIPQVYDLEDLNIQSGTFKNAGEGWNTFTFPEPFDTPPLVFVQTDNYGCDVKNIAVDRFLYKVTTQVTSSGNSKTLYSGRTSRSYDTDIVATSTSSLSSTTSFSVMTAAGSTSSAGVADAIDIRWLAIEYGGE